MFMMMFIVIKTIIYMTISHCIVRMAKFDHKRWLSPQGKLTISNIDFYKIYYKKENCFYVNDGVLTSRCTPTCRCKLQVQLHQRSSLYSGSLSLKFLYNLETKKQNFHLTMHLQQVTQATSYPYHVTPTALLIRKCS